MKDLQHWEARKPLNIAITDAGSITNRLYNLLRQALPVLEESESVPECYRKTLATNIRKELEGGEGDNPVVYGGEEEKPGSWFDTEE